MALPATDSFTDSNGTQLTAHSSDWTLNSGDFDIQSNACAPDAGGELGAHWNADVFDDDQYAEGEIKAVAANRAIGVACRCATNASENYYGWYSTSSNSYVFKVVADSWTSLGSGSAFSASDVIRLEVSGTTLTPMVGGVEEDPPGAQTDATFESGSAGVSGYNDSVDARIDDWEGGDLGGGGVDVSLDTLALTGAAQGMTVSPGAVNVALDALGLTAAAQSLTVQAVTTIALDALALIGVAQGLTVSPGEATTALDLLTLTGATQGLTVSSGAVSVALDALGLTATAQGLTVSPGAVSVVLDALGLSASAETITISSGVIVALNALALSIQAESLGVSPGAVAVELASLGLTGAAQGLDILPGAVTIALDALTLASAAGPLTVSTGIRVALDALALTGTVLGTTVEPGSVGVSLDALNLTAAILALSIAAGADMIDVDVSDALVWGAMVADALLYHVEVSDTSRE